MTLAPLEEHQLLKISIDSLKFDETNPNELTQEQMEGLRKSMKKFGYLTPIIVDQNNMIADGEHRALIYKEFGFTEIPGFKVTLKDDIERRMLRQVMNKLHGEHEHQRDATELLRIFESKRLDELAELIAQPREGLEKILTQYHGINFQQSDTFGMPQTLEELVPITKLGDIWQLGNHKIICADCTDKRSVDKLLEDEKADIILTDPPYSSGGFQEAGKASGSIGTRQQASIRNDVLSTRGFQNLMNEALGSINAEVLYLFTDWRMWLYTFDISEKAGFGVRGMIVWDKMHFGMGFPWRSQHELILYGKKSPNKNNSEGNKGNVLQAERTGNINHPTEKPISLLTQLLENTDGKNVIDPFIGSGSTLIACEQTNRICYGCEIDPHYCDVIVKRWEQYTGKQAEKGK